MTDTRTFRSIPALFLSRFCVLIVGCLGLCSSPFAGQTPVEAATSGSAQTSPSQAPNAHGTPVSKRWKALTDLQKQALAPLRAQWGNLTAAQRKKWLVLSRTFLQLSDEEQMTMHSRMRAWASLSAKDRNQARFNFNSAQSLSIEDKLAQWEAYQGLSQENKKQLSSGPRPPTKSTARTNTPTTNRLISPPALPVDNSKAIARVAPSQPVDPKTLLPKLQTP